jgi:hypothetical protein
MRVPADAPVRSESSSQATSAALQMRSLGPAPVTRTLRAEYKTIVIQRSTLAAAGLSDGELLNPSVCVHQGRLRLMVRVLAHAKTYNFLGVLTNDWEIAEAREVKNLLPGRRNPFGYEDCRIFSLGESLHASATALDTYATMTVLDLNEDGDIVGAHSQKSGRHEKNWMPAVVGQDLKFIYSTESGTVLTYDRTTYEVCPPVEELPSGKFGHLRGGSQLCAFEDGFIAVVHQVHSSPTTYLHRFVSFDRDLRVVNLGEPFHFRRVGIEFCAGLARWRDRWVVSFGVADKEIHLGLVEDDVVRRMIA